MRSNGRSKSTSSAFRKSLSLRKSGHPKHVQAELSTDDTPPGVLRIFGPDISPGTQYKSVLASSNSVASELIAEALDRYAIQRHYAPYFVLCDVIGRVAQGDDSTSEWMEECARIIGDDERPLTLQSLWKPSEGFARRFELRNRRHFHHEVSVDARAPVERLQSYHDVDDVDNLSNSTSSSGASLIRANLQRIVDRDSDVTSSRDEQRLETSQKQMTSAFEQPITSPFLVSLSGSCDRPLHYLHDYVTTIGSATDNLQPCDVSLVENDILPHHCSIKKDPMTSSYAVTPEQSGKVTVNNQHVTQPTHLQSGDVIGVGENLMLVFRDPIYEKSLNSIQSLAVVKLIRAANLPLQDAPDTYGVTTTNTQTGSRERKWQTRYTADDKRLKLSYSPEREDDLLQTIMTLNDVNAHLFALAPCFLLAMCVEHAAACHVIGCVDILLRKIAHVVKNSAIVRK